MSTTILKLISTNVSFVPKGEQQTKAKELLKEFCNSTDLEFTTTEAVEFIDQGENFESISCNLCGSDIEIEYWQASMDHSYTQHFEDLSIQTPCCHRPTTLNDLVYRSAAGFAKFVIAIHEPTQEMRDQDLSQLESILDTKLRVIYARY